MHQVDKGRGAYRIQIFDILQIRWNIKFQTFRPKLFP